MGTLLALSCHDFSNYSFTGLKMNAINCKLADLNVTVPTLGLLFFQNLVAQVLVHVSFFPRLGCPSFCCQSLG